MEEESGDDEATIGENTGNKYSGKVPKPNFQPQKSK